MRCRGYEAIRKPSFGVADPRIEIRTVGIQKIKDGPEAMVRSPAVFATLVRKYVAPRLLEKPTTAPT